MIGREVMVERRFPGALTWALTWAVPTWSGFGLLWLAAGGLRAIEPVTLIVTAPLVTLVLVAWCSFVIAKAFGLKMVGVLQGTLSLAPLAAVPGMLGALLLLGWSLVYSSTPPSLIHGGLVSIPGAGSAFLTLGLLPRPIASIGVIATLAVVCWFTWDMGKRVQATPVSRWYAVAGVWLGSIFLFLLPSAVSWIGLGADASPFRAGSAALERGLLTAVHNGYWWPRVYERFFSTGGEVASSIAYTFAAGLFLLATFLALAWFGRARLRFSVWFRLLSLKPLLLEVVFLLIGVAFTWKAVPVFSGATKWLSLLVLLVVLFGFRLAMSLGEAFRSPGMLADGNTHPMQTGEFSLGLAREVKPFLLVLSTIGAWLLGWPMFFTHLVRLLADQASVAGLPILPVSVQKSFVRFWRGLDIGLVCVMGGLWGSAAASPPIPTLLLAFFLAIACLFLGPFLWREVPPTPEA